MLTGLNHLTLAVRDLERSLVFYRNTLGLHLHARWDRGAYLSAGDLWLCLSLDRQASDAQLASAGYTHTAFSIVEANFVAFATHLRDAGVLEWKRNCSEGDSVYFLDPDGHQLEVHVGGLATRLAACRAAPYDGMVFFDE